MKKGWQTLIILLVILQIFSVGYFIHLNNETRKDNKLLELDLDLVVKSKNYELGDRIHRVESLSAGLNKSVKFIITHEVKELFAKGTVFPHSPCSIIRNKFKEVYISMDSMAQTIWFDEAKGKRFTNNEVFIYSFEELRNKYSFNKERLLAVERVEQCLLDDFLQ